MATKKENLKMMKGDEIEKKLSTLSEDLRALKFKAEGSKTKNVKEAATLRKEIARILTAMNDPKTKTA